MNEQFAERVRKQIMDAEMQDWLKVPDIDPDALRSELNICQRLRDEDFGKLTSAECWRLILSIEQYNTENYPSIERVDLISHVRLYKMYKDMLDDYADILTESLQNGGFDDMPYNYYNNYIPMMIAQSILMQKRDPEFWTEEQQTVWSDVIELNDNKTEYPDVIAWVASRIVVPKSDDDRYFNARQHKQDQVWCLMQVMQSYNRHVEICNNDLTRDGGYKERCHERLMDVIVTCAGYDPIQIQYDSASGVDQTRLYETQHGFEGILEI